MSGSRYRFELASTEDDIALRARMAADFMSGAISVTFRREPSYFAGCRIQGEATQVVKCVRTDTEEIIGMGARSTVIAWVDGQPKRIGYLSDLRLDRKYRGGLLVARGYRVLRALHEADPVPFYTTVIYEGNDPARSALVGARAGLPIYKDWGRILTPAIRLDFPVRQAPVPGVMIERGSRERFADIVTFINREAKKHQFAAVYRSEYFIDGRFAGVAPESFFLAIRAGEICGTLAAWDQASVRQIHVHGYSPSLAFARPLYNVLSNLLPIKPLPSIGERIPCLYLACAFTSNGDVPLFRHLLRAAHEALRQGPWSYAVCGLHEADPRAEELLALRHIPAAGRLFVVHYPEQPPKLRSQRECVPYIEAGCL
jgi:hypothetical protein